MNTFLLIGGGIIVGVGIGAGVWWIVARQRKERIRKLLSLKPLLIKLPQHNEQKEGSPSGSFKEEINLTEQLLSALTSNKDISILEAAVHHIGEEIHFYIVVSEAMVSFVSRQIEGLFKDARIELAPEYNIFHPNGINAGFYIKQQSHYALKMRTYVETESDTFSPIISALSRVNEVGEGIAIQVLVRPAQDEYKKKIFGIINEMRKGKSFKEMTGSMGSMAAKEMGKLFESENKKKEKENKPSIVDEESIKELEKKVAKPLLKVNYRVLVSTASQAQTDSLLSGIAGAFAQFESPLKNKFKIVKASNFNKLAYQFAFREFDEGQAMILNTEELAGMFHLPSSTTLSSRIKWLKSKEAAPPVDLPTQGTKIGESHFRGDTRSVYITDEDRRRHVYIIGQTGTGKSALITNMAAEDIAQGKGVAVLDPHGDLIEKLLALVPKERVDDVVLFDPGYIQKPIGLNMLEYDFDKPEQKTFIVNEMLSIFDRLYDMKTAGGPMFEMYMRNALQLLMEDAANEPATLVEVPRIFTDNDYRNRKLDRITNPVVVDFWNKEATKVGGDASLANMSPYITSKFNNFIANDYMRPIIGQTQSSFNFRKLMDERKILLVNLSKGRIGDINANLLGMIVVGKLLMAAFSRIDTPENERKDFNLYIDEFQNFTTDSISTILSEARKYRLNLVIAHQFIAQLQEKIRDSVFGNVGSMIVFRIGADDAQYLVKQFEPVFSERDLISIDNLNAYVKLLVRGQTTVPFNIHTLLYPKMDMAYGEKVKELAMLKYGADRAAVEADILRRLRS
jgi:hypothetical protein